MTKPFNLDDAKAGYPVQTASAGMQAKLIATDLAHSSMLYQIGGNIFYCSVDGFLRNVTGVQHPHQTLVMSPIGEFDGREVYPGDMLMSVYGKVVPLPHDVPFDAALYICPPKKYPVTQMTEEQLCIVENREPHRPVDFLAVANAAIRHGIDNGYLLVPDGDVDEHFRVAQDRGRILAEIAKGLGWESGYAYAAIPASVRLREVEIARHFYDLAYRNVFATCGMVSQPRPPISVDVVTSELVKVK